MGPPVTMEATETVTLVPPTAAQMVPTATIAGRIIPGILLTLSRQINIPLRLCQSFSAQFLEYLV
jgi:hypothetical protein